MHLVIIDKVESTTRSQHGELMIKGFPKVRAVCDASFWGAIRCAFRLLLHGIKPTAKETRSGFNMDWEEYIVEVPRHLAGKILCGTKLQGGDRLKFKPSIVQDH